MNDKVRIRAFKAENVKYPRNMVKIYVKNVIIFLQIFIRKIFHSKSKISQE